MICSTSAGTADADTLKRNVRVEVFCVDGCTVPSQPVKYDNVFITMTDAQVYSLGEIERIEVALSDKLGMQIGPAKRLALQRIQGMDPTTRERLQNAAHGLSKVMQYGIDRVPAIIIDSQVVVYGVSDLQRAIVHYQTWRTEGQP